MAQELDSLEVKINATATKAINSVDKLINQLTRLSSSLMNINSSSLTGLSNGINQLNFAMQNMNAKTTDFTSLAKNITKIGSVDSVALNNTAVSLQAVNKAIGNISAIPNNAAQVTEFAKSLGKLGSKSIENATVNIPKLGNALNGLMTTLSRAPSVSSNVVQMTNALANLASQGSKVGSSSTSLQKSLYGVSNSARSTSNSSWSLARSFGKLYANYFLVIRGAKQLWKSIESSMDYVETLNYFNAAFGQVAESAVKNWEESGYDSAEAYYNSFSKRAEELTSKMSGYTVSDSGMLVSTSQKSLGIDPEQLMNYQSVFGQMSSSMGATSENALILSNVLSEIGADLASVKNMDFSEVWNDMSSGLAGMSRTLDKYGVNIRNVNLQQELTNLGITANITNLNQNEKALLRTIILLNSTKYAWGDLSRTLDQPANQLRLLQSNFSNLARTIGNIFLPMVAKVLPYINALTIVTQRAAQAIVSFLGFSDFDWGGLGGMSSNDALSDIYDEVGDVSDGLSDATGNAKELKNTLMGFDEINKLSDTTDSSGSSASGSGLSAADTAKLDEAFKKMASEYQAAWDKAFEGVSNRAQELADILEQKFEPVKKIFQDFAVGDFKMAGKDTSELVAGILNWFADAIDKVPWFTIGQKMGDYLAGIEWIKVFKAAGRVIVQGLKGAIELYFGMLTSAPIETALISLIAIPKLMKAIGGSSVIASITKGYKTLNTLSITAEDTAKAMIAAKNGNTAAASALTFLHPKIAKTTVAFQDFGKAVKDKGLFSALNDGVTSVRDKMTILQKGVVATIGVFSEFTLVKSSFYDLASGSDNLVAAIGKIAAGAGIATTALKLIGLSNPFTALIVGATALVSSIIGISQAVKDAEFSSMFTALKDNGTVTMKELGDVAIDAFGQITDGVEQTTEKLKSIADSRESLEQTTENVELLKTAVENGAYTTNEKMPEIIEQFRNLLTESKSVFNDEYEVIVGNVVGAWKDILEAQGVAIPEYVAQLASLRDKGNESFASMSTDLEGLIQQFNDGKISEQEFLDAATPLIEKISSINKDNSVDNATLAIQGFGGALDISQYITEDGLDVDKFNSAVAEVVTAAQNGKDNLNTLGEESSQAISDMRERLEALGVDASQFDWSTLYGASDTQVQEGTQRIDSAYMQYANQVQYNLLNQLPSVVEQATQDYDKLNPIAKIFTTKENYIKSVIDKWERNVLDPALNSVKDGFNELGIDGSVYADEAADKLTSSLFDNIKVYSNVGVNNTKPKLKEDWRDMLDSALSEAGEAVDVEGYGKNTVEGFVDGIANNTDRSNEAIRNWMDELDRNIHDSAMDFGSPSRRTEQYGSWVIEGFNNGITSNLNSTYDTINDYVGNVISAFDGIYDSLWDNGRNAGRGFYDGLESMENNIFKEARYIADNVSDTIRDSLDIHSPSRVMKKLGAYTIEGFKLGMEKSYEPVEVSLSSFTDDIIASVPTSTFNANNITPPIPDNSSSIDETNALLRQLIYAVENGRTIEIDGQEIFRVTQKQANMYTAMTGLPAYNI